MGRRYNVMCNKWSFSLTVVDDLHTLGAAWLDLESRARASFFQSWGWVGSWLEVLPDTQNPYVLEIRRDNTIVGLAVLGYRAIRRHGVFWSRTLRVTETGRAEYDNLTVEHNGILVERDLEPEVLRRCLPWLVHSTQRWDELFISGVDATKIDTYTAAASASGLCAVVTHEKPWFLVNLENLRASGTDLVSVLSRNTRHQIRRSIREYEKHGPVTLRVAKTLVEAKNFFAEMKALHQAQWNARGEPGAFATDFSNEFHRRLMESRFEEGAIQLLKICAGSKRIGYLYNFVHDGVVCNYQSGFEREEDPRLKWGMVSHCKAIDYALREGMRTYDFLMGNQRYKRSLATTTEYMTWLVLQQHRIRFKVEAQARAGWRLILMKRLSGRFRRDD